MPCKHGCRNSFYYFLIRVLLGLPLIPEASFAFYIKFVVSSRIYGFLSNTGTIRPRELKESAFHVDVDYLAGRADIL